MKHGMPMPRLPDVIGGQADALERFMGDYLVGMFDNAAPLVIEPVDAVRVQFVFARRGLIIELVSLPAGGQMVCALDTDTVELDLFNEIERVVGGTVTGAVGIVGIQAVRLPAGVECVRRAGPAGASWLAFSGEFQ